MANRTAGALATFLGCSLQGENALTLKTVASPEAAEADDLIYLDSSRHIERVVGSAALCVITSLSTTEDPAIPVCAATSVRSPT